MGWDRKKRGASNGYFYLSRRESGKPYPVKIYVGRGAAGQEAAAAVEKHRLDRHRAKVAVRAECEATAEADRLAKLLQSWADTLTAAWLVLSGHHCHRGCWRTKRG